MDIEYEFSWTSWVGLAVDVWPVAVPCSAAVPCRYEPYLGSISLADSFRILSILYHITKR